MFIVVLLEELGGGRGGGGGGGGVQLTNESNICPENMEGTDWILQK
jgi:hypothetical protein